METKQQSSGSVVGSFSMPKLKLPSDKAAATSAFMLSLATFFGFLTIFAAIASFTDGDWFFGIPIVSIFFANTPLYLNELFTALASILFSIIGLKTLTQITSKNDLVKPWQCVAKIFMFLTAIYVIMLVAIALFSLMGVGKDSGVPHRTLWLNGFLPEFITTFAAAIVCYFAKQIAAGKTIILRNLSFFTVGIASIGFILTIISTLVTLYS